MPHVYVRTCTISFYIFVLWCLGYFSPMRSVSVVMKQAFFTLNCFSEPKLVKTLLILIKWSLIYTLYFSVTP